MEARLPFLSAEGCRGCPGAQNGTEGRGSLTVNAVASGDVAGAAVGSRGSASRCGVSRSGVSSVRLASRLGRRSTRAPGLGE